MNQAEIVKRFLQNREDVDIRESGLPFVTISRQAGVGGHALGRGIVRAVEHLKHPDIAAGWDLFDQKLCAMLAQSESGEASFDTLINEEYKTGVHQSVYEMFLGRPEQYQLQKKISEVIVLLAKLGKVVVLGRGSMCITRDIPNGIRIRLVAPEKIRIKSMMEYIGGSEKEAEKAMRKQDKSREAFVREVFGRDINDPLLFDAIFNTGTLNQEEIVSAVVRLIEEKWLALKESKQKRSSLEF